MVGLLTTFCIYFPSNHFRVLGGGLILSNFMKNVICTQIMTSVSPGKGQNEKDRLLVNLPTSDRPREWRLPIFQKPRTINVLPISLPFQKNRASFLLPDHSNAFLSHDINSFSNSFVRRSIGYMKANEGTLPRGKVSRVPGSIQKFSSGIIAF